MFTAVLYLANVRIIKTRTPESERERESERARKSFGTRQQCQNHPNPQFTDQILLLKIIVGIKMFSTLISQLNFSKRGELDVCDLQKKHFG